MENLNQNHQMSSHETNVEDYLHNSSLEFLKLMILCNIPRKLKSLSCLSSPWRPSPDPWGNFLWYCTDGSSAIYLPALPHVITGLNTNSNLVNLTVALYMWALGLFPLWWSAASERVGRRTIYVISFALWIIFNVLSATSQNIIELIIMRILAAGAGASVQAVGAGTLADIYIPQQRGRAMGWFYIGPLTGPLIVLHHTSVLI